MAAAASPRAPPGFTTSASFVAILSPREAISNAPRRPLLPRRGARSVVMEISTACRSADDRKRPPKIASLRTSASSVVFAIGPAAAAGAGIIMRGVLAAARARAAPVAASRPRRRGLLRGGRRACAGARSSAAKSTSRPHRCGVIFCTAAAPLPHRAPGRAELLKCSVLDGRERHGSSVPISHAASVKLRRIAPSRLHQYAASKTVNP